MLFYKNLCLHKSVENARKSWETKRLIKTTLNELNFQAISEKLKIMREDSSVNSTETSFRCKEKRGIYNLQSKMEHLENWSKNTK